MYSGMKKRTCCLRRAIIIKLLSHLLFAFILLGNHLSFCTCTVSALLSHSTLLAAKQSMLPTLAAFTTRQLGKSTLPTFSRHDLIRRLASSNDDNSTSSNQTDVSSSSSSSNIAIVGGGLAGLSTAYHLLQRTVSSNKYPTPSITIFDKTLPGKGGASAVAGGLLHPFSPRGKLVYFGKEGLEESNSLIEVSQKYEPGCVLRDKLYRIALTEKNVNDLRRTSSLHPEYATWLSSDDIETQCGSLTKSKGGVLLSNGCKVIHVPTYLSGLWKACEDLTDNTITWSIIDDESEDQSRPGSSNFWQHNLQQFDTVVFSAGSGLFHDSILKQDAVDFPTELVRGQSLELTLGDEILEQSNFSNQAILCGKYTTPLKGKNKVLIGATHEYKKEPFEKDDVLADLRARSFDLAPFVWEQGKVDRITSGYRVQSRRGKYGRIPIIGKAQYDDIHHNSWLFTGLSARGLIYHGIYGKILSEAIAQNDESRITKLMPDGLWWKE